jgi:hypothetical protein
MYYLDSVDRNNMAAHLAGNDCDCFKKCRTFSAVDGTDDGMLWNGNEEDGNVRSECEEDECTLTVNMETVTLIGTL